MQAYFKPARQAILAALEACLAEQGQVYAAVAPQLGADAAARLLAFAARGKLLRGCLVYLGYELAGGDRTAPAADQQLAGAGAAMELFQSGLLIHDDIMDRDRMRRGAPTLHVGYETSLAADGATDPGHHGAALGICAGDLAFFAAFQLLAGLPCDPVIALRVSALAARELALVGVAQMQDVANGAQPAGGAEPTASDILRLYRYKTGRYTFSLPLALGATLANAPAADVAALEAAGERLGIVFQLKDDELGLFAEQAELGKPVGSDIREDKKTFLRLRLLERADAAGQSGLRAIFGRGQPSAADLASVRQVVGELGVRSELQTMMQSETALALAGCGSLMSRASSAAAAAFRALAAYSLNRSF
ncbi:MAG: hypothetical protein A2Y37_08295 [Spirochaetes bacterium GWB1_60_80]|nr:MAG: hypothetical protein A2Y37_08295 [Spirochaetes bacterium GWB1_60_80]OHD45825.1 MAG: hypothetical protein A2Y35_03930 [Spirochaetes bacterium GWE1_60_18]OHD58368.1 MAG: hypothetical protein A2Y32_06320 [Spirochaetes bacterium GWF1_60_12]HAX37710.1 polyprenyl synthetase [Spirochaetaceae bacterium]HBO41098.1 polyprenyl synthetase [Spirochaetaceae bacterium]